MNLMEFFVNMNQRDKQKNWIEATATFTGKRNRAARKVKYGFVEENWYTYEVTYEVKGKEQRSWYEFHPLPDPEPDEIRGTTVQIHYKKSKPFLISKVLEEDTEEEE